jgi:RNA polymerase sigma-70 factor (ECF subfamily)
MDRFQTLLVDEIPSLRRYAKVLCKDRDQADDLVQECLLRAISRRKLWLGHKGIRPWLFTIMHNLFVNALRRPAHLYVDTLSEGYSNTAIADDHAEELSMLADFEKCFTTLSTEQREVLVLVGVEQLSYKRVAKITNVPVGTVMSRLARAREQLRKTLDGEAQSTKIKRIK